MKCLHQFCCRKRLHYLVAILLQLHRGTGPISDNCIFTQHILVSNWDIFTNLRHPNWVIAFNGNGRPKKGPKTSPNKREAHFLRMPPKGVSAGDIVRTEYSPSALDNDEWDKYTEELQNSLRSSHLSSMQGDDPRIWQSEIPLDVQEELEKRRKEKEQWEKSKMLSSTIQPSQTTADSGRSSDRFRKERHRKNKNRRNRRKEKRQKLSATDVTISNSDVTANLVNDNNNARPFKLNGYSLTTKEVPVRHSRQSSRNRRSKNLSTRKRRKNRKQLKQSREITWCGNGSLVLEKKWLITWQEGSFAGKKRRDGGFPS